MCQTPNSLPVTIEQKMAEFWFENLNFSVFFIVYRQKMKSKLTFDRMY